MDYTHEEYEKLKKEINYHNYSPEDLFKSARTSSRTPRRWAPAVTHRRSEKATIRYFFIFQFG